VSGRPKVPAVSTADEMRQLTRELHETAKDARAAAAALHAARGGIRASVEDEVAAAANAAIGKMQAHVDQNAKEVQKQLGDGTIKIMAHYSRILGCQDPAALLTAVAEHVTPRIARDMTEIVRELLPDVVRAQLLDLLGLNSPDREKIHDKLVKALAKTADPEKTLDALFTDRKGARR